jgi:hypothetical protein
MDVLEQDKDPPLETVFPNEPQKTFEPTLSQRVFVAKVYHAKRVVELGYTGFTRDTPQNAVHLNEVGVVDVYDRAQGVNVGG